MNYVSDCYSLGKLLSSFILFQTPKTETGIKGFFPVALTSVTVAYF